MYTPTHLTFPFEVVLAVYLGHTSMCVPGLPLGITSYHKDASFWQSLSTKHRTKSLTHQTGNYPVTCFVSSRPSGITLVKFHSLGVFRCCARAEQRLSRNQVYAQHAPKACCVAALRNTQLNCTTRLAAVFCFFFCCGAFYAAGDCFLGGGSFSYAAGENFFRTVFAAAELLLKTLFCFLQRLFSFLHCFMIRLFFC